MRTPEEFAESHIENAVNIPLDTLRGRLDEIPKDKMIFSICAIGLRAYVAYRLLEQSGFKNIAVLSGGYNLYRTAMSPV